MKKMITTTKDSHKRLSTYSGNGSFQNIPRLILFVICLFISNSIMCYNIHKILLEKKSNIKWNIVKNSFSDYSPIKDGDGGKYTCKIDSIDLIYIYLNEECDYFVLNGSRFCPDDYIHDWSTCELDVNSFILYKTKYNNHQYLLLTAVNNGSGKSTNYTICLLFDITDQNKIVLYPLWSKYGGKECFGDFNKDGYIDFVKIKGDDLSMEVSLWTLMDGDVIALRNKTHAVKKKNIIKVKVL